jgi:hypothetical protein
MFRNWFMANVVDYPKPAVEPPGTFPASAGPYVAIQGNYVADYKPIGVNQRRQEVYGLQTNIASNATGRPDTLW